MKKWWKNKSVIIATVLALFAAAFGLYVSNFDALPQASYHLFDQLKKPTSTDRVLIVAPHQDDDTLGAGGYIQQAEAAGSTVELVFATDGNKHGQADLRHQEAIKADERLGLTVSQIKFFNYPDGKLSSQVDFPVQLSKEIDSFRPTVVLTTLPNDLHPDHAKCGAVVQAIYQQEHSFQPIYFLIHYHRYPRPIGEKPSAYLLPPDDLVVSNYSWQVLPLTESEQNTKHQAITDYKSQLSIRNPILRQLLWSFDRPNELFALPR